MLGLTIFNDSAGRDIQRREGATRGREMNGGSARSTGRGFVAAAEPWIASLDELPVHRLKVTARVNRLGMPATGWTPACWNRAR
jgi:hypothetical protein